MPFSAAVASAAIFRCHLPLPPKANAVPEGGMEGGSFRRLCPAATSFSDFQKFRLTAG
jgi:hypothetical protein